MSARQVSAEDFVLRPGEEPFDVVFAVRVGALDGRHPEIGDLEPLPELQRLDQDGPAATVC